MPGEKTDTPSSRISPVCLVPAWISFIRLMDRRKVLFPHPEGPIRAVTACRGMVRARSKSTCFDPYQNAYWRTSSTGGEPLPADGVCCCTDGTGAVGAGGVIRTVR